MLGSPFWIPSPPQYVPAAGQLGPLAPVLPPLLDELALPEEVVLLDELPLEPVVEDAVLPCEPPEVDDALVPAVWVLPHPTRITTEIAARRMGPLRLTHTLSVVSARSCGLPGA